MKSSPLMALFVLAGCGGSGVVDQADSPSPKALKTADSIPTMMEAFGVDGLAVTAVSGDTVLQAQGYGATQEGEAFTASTRCGLCSATKTLASLAYTKLHSEGRLDLDQKLGAYI